MILGSLGILYLEVTILALRSVSIRAMVEIERAPGATLTPGALERLYRTEAMFDQRIDALVANRLLSEADGRYATTPRGAALARVFAAVRWLFNLTTYG